MIDCDSLPCRRTWLGTPSDFAALFGLVALVAARWWKTVSSEVPLVDEAVYLRAFEAVAAGGSPYTVEGYYYPTAFAQVGAAALELLGQSPTLWALRGLVLTSLASVVWLSLSCWPMSRGRRFLIGAGYLLLAPAVGLSLVFGNVSFLVLALMLVAFFVWTRRPWLAGLLLGMSVAIKPLAPLAVLALAVHRPKHRPTGSTIPPHWLAAALAVSISAFVLLPPARLLAMTSQPITGHNFFRTISLHRILSLFDLDVSPLLVAIVVAAVVVVVCRWRPLSQIEVLCVATAAALMAAPVIWAHTLVLALPMQAIALWRASERRAEHRGDSPHQRYEIWFVVLAVASTPVREGHVPGRYPGSAVPGNRPQRALPGLAGSGRLCCCDQPNRCCAGRATFEQTGAPSAQLVDRTTPGPPMSF